MAGGLKTTNSMVLPALREGLVFVEHQAGRNDACFWQIRDPLQHRYFRISNDTKNILSIWASGMRFESLARAVGDKFGLELTIEKYQELVRFLDGANLLDQPDGSWKELESKRVLARPSASGHFAKLTFFKLPLFNPEPMLRRLTPFTDRLFTKTFAILIALVVLSGLYVSLFDMVAVLSQPWGGFEVGGFFQIFLALVILKACHELGHAISAYRFGCRVPTLGLAFMVFIPLLYTDVTDAWQLKSRNQRVIISASGMIVEIVVAGVATLLWAFLVDGTAKDITFYIATVGWFSSLAFNLNPFAKFDGYYILSDLTGIENLQSRAFKIARWKLRRVLLMRNLKPPEIFERKVAGGLVVYASLVVVYRLVVFIGISLLFYAYTAKVLGIVLVGLTLFQFVLLPVGRELRIWRELAVKHGSEFSFNRPVVFACLVIAVLFLPVFGTVQVPSVLVAAQLQKVYPPKDALIASVHVHQSNTVKTGASLVRFEVPELAVEATKINLELEAARRHLGRAVSNQTDRSQMTVLRNDILALERSKLKLAEEIGTLVIASRFDGEVVQTSRQLREGNWVSRHNWVAMIRSPEGVITRGYVDEGDLDRVVVGTTGRFIPDDVTRPAVSLVVSQISSDAARQIDLRELASIYGGPVDVVSERNSGLVSVRPVFPIELRTVEQIEMPNQVVRGTVLLNGRRKSIATSVWKRVTHVFIKEGTF